MKNRRIISVLLAALIALSLTACSNSSTESSEISSETSEIESSAEASSEVSAADYSNTTITGEVTAIEDGVVTLQLGEITEEEASEMPTDKPDGESTDSTESTDGETPPDKPDGEGTESTDGETPPEKPDGEGGESTDGETPPDKPDGEGTESTDGETPPDKPDGEGTESTDGETPPEKPDGEGTESTDGETPPDKPDGEGGDMMSGGTTKTFTAGDEAAELDLSEAAITKNDEEISIDDIAVGDVLTIVFGDDNEISSVTVEDLSSGGMSGSGGGFGGSGTVTQGTAANTIDADSEISGESYSSTGDDENALRVDGATVTLDGVTVDKSAGASSNTEDGDFYGMNAALLATNGANVTITNATVTSSAQNGNGVFSYGEGTVVNISDSTITTTADNSGGIQTTGGGTTNASNLTVETSGSSAAAIRSDRGGGTVNVDGGSYTSNGYNSPAVYSTAEITVKNATLTANNSEALVIEGQNSITLEDCEVEGNMSDTNGTSSDENVHNVMIYQSMSGDAEVGTSSFSMTGGTLTSDNGDMFYITNTNCILTLSGVEIVNKDEDSYLLLVSGNSASHGWGNAGSNGATVEFTADGQTLSGDIAVDSISTLSMTLSNGSDFTGTVNIIENAEGGTAVSENAVITVEEGSTWTLTGDCTVTSLTNNGTINFNGYSITLADGSVLS